MKYETHKDFGLRIKMRISRTEIHNQERLYQKFDLRNEIKQVLFILQLIFNS